MGELTISVMISPDMAPSVQVVVYAVLPSGGVVANSAEFTTEKCFSQKVSEAGAGEGRGGEGRGRTPMKARIPASVRCPWNSPTPRPSRGSSSP